MRSRAVIVSLLNANHHCQYCMMHLVTRMRGGDFPVSIAIANCELSSCCIFVCVPPTTQIGSHGGIVGG